MSYSATTHEITVRVHPHYLADQSSPSEGRFFWAYHVVIENHGTETVQLLNRYWQITDSLGRVQEVRGAGVVGQQPVLEPGSAFEYTSAAPLHTPSGIMLGSYEMENQARERFEVKIPAFSLDEPNQMGRMLN